MAFLSQPLLLSPAIGKAKIKQTSAKKVHSLSDPKEKTLKEFQETADKVQQTVQKCFDEKRAEMLKDRRWWQRKKAIAENKNYSVDAGGLVSSALPVAYGREAYDKYLHAHKAYKKGEGLHEELMQIGYIERERLSPELIGQIADKLGAIYADAEKGKVFDKQGLKNLLQGFAQNAAQQKIGLGSKDDDKKELDIGSMVEEANETQQVVFDQFSKQVQDFPPLIDERAKPAAKLPKNDKGKEEMNDD